MEKTYQTACSGHIIVPDYSIAHLRFDPNVDEVLKQTIEKIVLPQDYFFRTKRIFDHVIGQSSCVQVDHDDPKLFAVPFGKNTPVRVTINAKKVYTRSFVVIARRLASEQAVWRLVTAYFGDRAPRLPIDAHFSDAYFQNAKNNNYVDFLNSLIFWDTHALKWDSRLMEPVYPSSWKMELHSVGHPALKYVKLKL